MDRRKTRLKRRSYSKFRKSRSGKRILAKRTRIGRRKKTRNRKRTYKRRNIMKGGGDAASDEKPSKAVYNMIKKKIQGICKIKSDSNMKVKTTGTWVTDSSGRHLAADTEAPYNEGHPELGIYLIAGGGSDRYRLYWPDGRWGFTEEIWIPKSDVEIIELTPEMLTFHPNTGGDPKFAKWEVDLRKVVDVVKRED